MQRRTRQQLRISLLIVAIAAGLGAVFGLAIAGAGDGDGETRAYARAALRGVWTGGLIAGLLTAWEYIYVNRPAGLWVRRLTFLGNVGVRSLIYLAAIMLSIWSGATVFSIEGADPFGWNAQTVIQVGFSVLFSIGVNFAMAINGLLGQAVFLNFLTGRYHRPVVENRVLLFADLVGSTAIAERIGDLGFHGFLNDVYRDLSAPVIELGGVIHKYVGDEMIVSWPDTAAGRSRALQCGIEFHALLAAAEARYKNTHGAAPALRIGIHAGPVVIGEMGDVRQEIVFLGDAMNTASRLVDMCRTLGRPLLVSEALRDAEPSEDGPALEPMGETGVRGKTRPVAVYAPAP
ncbi:adenylate/guanylate cyclase domain-containing protein [Minwuia thermotolerans]|uniref:Guanylate cyclase domain-containing protein n=1 Tax=Minwuia thermotolerans TaxID=2056226 RepID=A0A2M9FXF7_9PROT|nr:adenylate/guanylate cyclase domain-containing protein [Minwuia thermotolerans]PJK28145.1 hypothetical protein CVT23_19135 [Minwuia thermotolerans]